MTSRRWIVTVVGTVGLVVVSGAATLERSGHSEGPNSPSVERSSSGAKVDVNTAGAADLERLPGMDPELVQRIIANRPYRKIDDLVRRKILGRKQLAGIKEHISVGAGGRKAERAPSQEVSGRSPGPR